MLQNRLVLTEVFIHRSSFLSQLHQIKLRAVWKNSASVKRFLTKAKQFYLSMMRLFLVNGFQPVHYKFAGVFFSFLDLMLL